MSNTTMKTIGVDPAIRKCMEEREKAGNQLRQTVQDVQKECKHETVFECEYETPTHYSRYQYPIRVCSNCRLREERSCSGWKTLTDDRKTMTATREQISSLIIHY